MLRRFVYFLYYAGSITLIAGMQYDGYYLAFTLPTVVFLLCPIVLFLCRNMYHRSPPQGSVLAKAIKLWGYAARGKWTLNPVNLYKNFKGDDFWEAAKPSNIPDSQRPKWMTFDDKWVEEVRRGFKACSVFMWYPIYCTSFEVGRSRLLKLGIGLPYNQIINNLTSQAAVMVTDGVPNDVINNLDPLGLIIFIPICDLLVYPGLRKIGIKFTPIKRITAGFLTGSAAMIWAAVVQHYIYKACFIILSDVEDMFNDLWAVFRPTRVGHSCQPAKMPMETKLPLLLTYGYRVDLMFS
jgi:POT family proton-dependent oligopeptide transporter